MQANQSVEQRMKWLGIRESELEEKFARSGGPGGQNVNKVSTAVTLSHLPTGLSVTVQDSRSQAMNRRLARERLLDAIERSRERARLAEVSRREKTRRQRSPRPRALKKRILEGKRQRSKLKNYGAAWTTKVDRALRRSMSAVAASPPFPSIAQPSTRSTAGEN